VAAIFEVLGIPVSYADREARRVMNEDLSLRQDIIDHFGAESYAGGVLNSSFLAARVFTDPAELQQLNALVHPATIRAGQQWMASLPATTPYAIREAALIFESDSVRNLDFIIGVRAPATVRIHRTMQRDGLSREEVLQRMRNQIDEDIKMQLCDAVINNDEQTALLPQVMQLHERLLRLAGDRQP